ncbi:TetR/AcrR family transcriptional regulator [Sulfurimonas marina]|uniref:TetR/AcrR family transcriptional regulator n=1 Tax=Sulfurimonas marina TaxID=2590551 RepID=A0A7M1AVD2_9BACT|nr:TetR/AcrR family transcriptional regulator [Sulfurimonas marina]QOP41385.1 TetR/AcrR family transcriptional regulator [Sulfurimonas marina]
MARIVDKEQKKRDIALACKDMVVKNNINTLTVSSLAKAAKVGKGTIYEYFQNKEEIVFEIITIMMEEHRIALTKKLESVESTRDKVKKFSEFFYSEEDYELREMYKEFTAISLMTPTDEMIEFQSNSISTYYEWFESIVQEGIDKGELIPDAINLSRGLFVVGKGMYVTDVVSTTIYDLEEEFNLFIDSVFSLLEVK